MENVARIAAAFTQASRNLNSIPSSYLEEIGKATTLLVERLSTGKKLLVCGNGGSAADAMHICAELVGRFLRDRRPLPAIALNADPPILRALSNDYSYELVFARQVEALARPGDVVWGISTSGNSNNVVEALRTARGLGASTIAMTGEGGGTLRQHADVLLSAPSQVTPPIQEIHLVTYHTICDAVEQAFSTDRRGAASSAGGSLPVSGYAPPAHKSRDSGGEGPVQHRSAAPRCNRSRAEGQSQSVFRGGGESAA